MNKKTPYLFIDFETRNPVKNILKTHGTHQYAAHKQTEVLLLAYRLSTWKKDRVELWRGYKGEPFPKFLKSFRGVIVAHNWVFEFEIIKHKVLKLLPVGVKKHWGNPNNYLCTMAQSLRWGLPGKLEKAANTANLTQRKNVLLGEKALKYVHSMKLVNPLEKRVKGVERATRFIKLSEIPEQIWNDLEEYNIQDVLTTERLFTVLPQITGTELEIFKLDQKMNCFGFQVDLKSAKMARVAYGDLMGKAEKEAEKLAGLTPTGKFVVNSPAGFVKWINENAPDIKGGPIENAQAGTVETLLEIKTLPRKVRRVCELRQILSPSAPKKLDAFIYQPDLKGIARYQLQYYGAHTGRWAGRGIQPQNITRDCVDGKDFSKALKTFCGPKGDAREAGKLLRPLITARAKKVLVVRDYAQIELRVLLWMCGHNKELAIVADPEGDLYKHFAGESIYRTPFEEVTKEQRYVGKTAILGLGYGMGWEKFIMTLEQEGIIVDAKFSKRVVDNYRARFNRVKMFWSACEKAFISDAQETVRLTLPGGPAVSFYSSGRSRRIVLPSGRELNYLNVVKRTGRDGSEVSYQGKRGKTYVWGGVIVENIVQAIARDILAEGMLNCDKIPSVDLILSVHDEAIFEMKATPKSFVKNKVSVIDRTLLKGSPWCKGLPLEVEGAEGVKRYGK